MRSAMDPVQGSLAFELKGLNTRTKGGEVMGGRINSGVYPQLPTPDICHRDQKQQQKDRERWTEWGGEGE